MKSLSEKAQRRLEALWLVRLSQKPAVYLLEGSCSRPMYIATDDEALELCWLVENGLVESREENFFSEPYLWCGQGYVYRPTAQGTSLLAKHSNVRRHTLMTP
jgi:hypothetical protein